MDLVLSKSVGGGGVSRTIAKWTALIEAFEKSGLSRGDFCRMHGVSMASLSTWRKRLGYRGRALVKETAKRGLRPQFVDVGAALGLRSAKDPGESAKVRAEVDLGEGIVLRVYR